MKQEGQETGGWRDEGPWAVLCQRLHMCENSYYKNENFFYFLNQCLGTCDSIFRTNNVLYEYVDGRTGPQKPIFFVRWLASSSLQKQTDAKMFPNDRDEKNCHALRAVSQQCPLAGGEVERHRGTCKETLQPCLSWKRLPLLHLRETTPVNSRESHVMIPQE